MADEVRGRDREALIQRSIAMNEDLTGGGVGDNPFLTPDEQRERYRQIKRTTGSIYRPTLIPVHEAHTPVGLTSGREPSSSSYKVDLGTSTSTGPRMEINDWPPPPDFHPSKGLSTWTAPIDSSGQDSLTPSTSRNHKVGQVVAYRTADQLHPTPVRNNSARRKPVPAFDPEELDACADRSIVGHLSFISTSTSPAPDYTLSGSSPPVIPSRESSMSRDHPDQDGEGRYETSSGRPAKRRDTDPAHAVAPRSPDYDTSIYSSESTDDRQLFFRPPIGSPTSSSPGKSTTFSPRVSLVPPSASGSGESVGGRWRDGGESEPEMAMALSSLARVRRDTGVRLSGTLEPNSASTSGVREGREAVDRSSTTTWSSDDLTPRASERGWWSGDKVDT